MYKIWDKELVTDCEIIFMTPWCPANKLESYKVIILSVHTSGTTSTAVSFSAVILNNSESNKMYGSANVSTFLIAALEVGSLFYDKYR